MIKNVVLTVRTPGMMHDAQDPIKTRFEMMLYEHRHIWWRLHTAEGDVYIPPSILFFAILCILDNHVYAETALKKMVPQKAIFRSFRVVHTKVCDLPNATNSLVRST